MNRRKNAVPKPYKAYFITAGLAGYPDGVEGNVLVQKPALDKMLPTFRGMPVVNFEHTDLEPEDLFDMSKDQIDEIADGIVSAVGYDQNSAWYWADMLIWDTETIENIEDNGYSVSCAYDVTDLDQSGGTYNNVDYKEEVLDGDYVHMAIVPNPRYEKAYIIKNSKPGGQTVKVKFFPKKEKRVKNSEPEATEEKDEAVENMEEVDGVVVLEDGTEVPMDELLNAYRQRKNEEEETKENGTVFGVDDEVEIDGEKMTVRELMSAAGYGETKENEAELLDEEAEEVVDETLQNSKPKKKPASRAVRNAAQADDKEFKPSISLEHSRLKNGKTRYGSTVKQEVK